MAEPVRNVILAGFSSFGTYSSNPAKDMVIRYSGMNIGDIKVHGLILPCSYRSSFEILSEKIDELNPEGILSLRVNPNIKNISFEMRGNNALGKYFDAHNKNLKYDKIIHVDRDHYDTTFNHSGLVVELIGKGINVDISCDAQDFISNSLLYLTARKIFSERLKTKHGFMNVPNTKEHGGVFDSNTLDEVVLHTIIRLS